MEGLQHKLCFILDLEGFFVNKTFQVRELGYYAWNRENGRHAFSIPIPYKELSDKDKRTVNFVIKKIHGLSYQPLKAEYYRKPEELKDLILSLYARYKQGQRTVVGYKGGHVEKDLLKTLNIPSLDLETLGCPKYDKLRHIISNERLLPSCGFHQDESIHHCPVTECHAFWFWLTNIVQ